MFLIYAETNANKDKSWYVFGIYLHLQPSIFMESPIMSLNNPTVFKAVCWFTIQKY